MAEGDKTRDAERRTVLDRLCLLILQCFTVAVGFVPLPAGLWVARRFGSAYYHLSRRHRSVAVENLRHVYGDTLDEVALRRRAKRSIQSFVMTIWESVALPALIRSGKARELFSFSGVYREVQRMAGEKQPVMLVAGHYGCWEMAPLAAHYLGIPVTSVMRPARQAWFTDWMVWLRSSTPQELLYKRGAMLGMRRALARGRTLGLLVDQHARHGIWVPFLGRPARSNFIAGTLADRYGVPVYFGYCERVVPGKRYRFCISGPLSAARGETAEERIADVTARSTRAIGAIVKQMPDQWLWMHRRWREMGPDDELAV